jgi:hypothetical protein
MQTFQKPQQLNGAQLIDELLSVGINLDLRNYPAIDGNNNLLLGVDDNNYEKAKKVVDSHIGKEFYVSNNVNLATLASELSNPSTPQAGA